MRNNKMKGFTLVELLVVIAILAILATVSVVGYTAYIESAYVSNDNTVVGQLNSFAGILNADTESELFDTEITEDNVWEAIQIIKKEMAAEDLKPYALDYGYHYYFKFNEDGKGGEFVVLNYEEDIRASAMNRVWNYIVGAAGNDPKPGFFNGKDGRLYFLVDTTGSAIADAVRGFNTFDIELDTSDAGYEDAVKEKFAELVKNAQKADNEYGTNYETVLEQQGLIVDKYLLTTGTSDTQNPVVQSGVTDYTNIKITVDEEGYAKITDPSTEAPTFKVTEDTTINLSGEVTISAGSFNVTVESGASLTLNFTVENPEDVAKLVDAEFASTNVVIIINGKEYKHDDNEAQLVPNGTTNPGAAEIPLTYRNTLADFDIMVDGNDDTRFYNFISNDGADGTNVLNIPYVVWHEGKITLSLDPNSLVAQDKTSPLSNSSVQWELVGDYEGISLSDNTITLSKVNDLYPEIDTIKVKATAVYPKEGDKANHTFEIKLSRGTDMTVKVDNKVVTNSKINAFWGENASGNKNSYTIGATLTAWDNNKQSNFVYDDDIKIVIPEGATYTVSGSVVSTPANFLTESAAIKDITFDVIVGGYHKETVTVTLNYARVLFDILNENIQYVGTDGANITVAELFKNVSTVPAGATVAVNAYVIPGDTTVTTMQDLTPYLIPTTADKAEDGVYGTQTTTIDGNFDFNLTGSTNGHIILVVTVDGVRASENYELTVVNGANVRVWNDIKDGFNTNKVLLSDIAFPTDAQLSITGGTFYGNKFTLDVRNAKKDAAEHIISLTNATLDGVNIVGKVYSTFTYQKHTETVDSTSIVVSNNATIKNCYIANGRAPIRVIGDTKVEDSIIFGGRYCNIDVKKGVLTLAGDVTTINQIYKGAVGAGIVCDLTTDTNYVEADDCNLTQYNFIPKSGGSALPTVSITMTLGDYGATITVKMGSMVKKLLEDTTNYGNWKYDAKNETESYLNAGIVYLVADGGYTGFVPGCKGDWPLYKTHIACGCGKGMNDLYSGFVSAISSDNRNDKIPSGYSMATYTETYYPGPDDLGFYVNANAYVYSPTSKDASGNDTTFVNTWFKNAINAEFMAKYDPSNYVEGEMK